MEDKASNGDGDVGYLSNFDEIGTIYLWLRLDECGQDALAVVFARETGLPFAPPLLGQERPTYGFESVDGGNASVAAIPCGVLAASPQRNVDSFEICDKKEFKED